MISLTIVHQQKTNAFLQLIINMEAREYFPDKNSLSDCPAYLLYVKPVLQGQNINQLNVKSLPWPNNSLKHYSLFDNKEKCEATILLITFETIQDAVDFHEEMNPFLNYSQALLKSSLEQLEDIKITKLEVSTELEQFTFQNRQDEEKNPVLKRETSLEQLVKEDESETATHEQSDSTISIDQIEVQAENVSLTKVMLKAIEYSIMAGFFYGVYKLYQYAQN